MISQIIKLVSLLLFIIISPFYGCVTINDLNEMKLELSSEEVTDNIEELNNILEAKETDDPYFYWKVMDTAAYIAKISSLYKLNNNAYIRLKNNYKDIVFNEPFPDDEYDWIDKGYNVIDSKELLSTNAIKYISFIESPNSLDDLIQLLNDVNEKNPKYDIHRKIIMSLLLDNIEKISDDLYLKQKLMVSLCKTSTVINDNDIKNLVISLRKKISDLDLYISLISNYKKFFKNDNYFLRLLDFNEIYWKEIVKGNFKKYNKKLLINFNQLGILSNSNMDIILTNTGIDKLPQRTNNRNIITRTNSLLKNYIPELYYRKILIESNKDIERLLETHRIQSYIKEIRNTNYNNKIGINKNDKSFFNYNLVLNKDYNIENDLLFKKINFESLIGRVYKQNEKYQSEILSSLSKIYPIYLYQFLLNNLKKDDLDIKIINQAILYAYFLQNEFKNNDLEELKQSLITFISKKILNYESYDLNKFFNENIKLLINLYDIKLPKIFDELIQNNELNYDEQIIITKFFLISLVNIEDDYNIFRFGNSISKLLSYQNEENTKKLIGFFALRSPNQFIPIFIDATIFNEDINTKIYNLYYLAQYAHENYSNLDIRTKRKTFDAFYKYINNSNEEKSLIGISNALKFNENFIDVNVLISILEKNYDFKK